MKSLTYNATANAALLLMQASPIEQTTSLETKTLLRELGFEANQKEVSDNLVQLGDNLQLNTKTVTEKGNTFRVYSIVPFAPEVDEDETGFSFRK